MSIENKMAALVESLKAYEEVAESALDYDRDIVPVWALTELEEDYGEELETYEEMAYRAYTEGKYTYGQYCYVCANYEHCTPRAQR